MSLSADGVDSDCAQAAAQQQAEEDAFERSQTSAVTDIESVIRELGTIYRRLATIVAIQNETILR